MYISAAIKADTGDGDGDVVYAFSENLEVPNLYDSDSEIDLVDYTVAGLLSQFFRSIYRDTALESRYPSLMALSASDEVDLYDVPSIQMGSVLSSFRDPSHGDSVSFVCFTESTIRNYLIKGFEDMGNHIDAYPIELLTNAAKTLPMNQLDIFLSEKMTQLSGGREQYIMKFHEKPILTIKRLTESDLNMATEGSYFEVETPFYDAFDQIKDRVTNQEPFLNSMGCAPAVYTDNGGDGSNDTIVFTAEYGMTQKVISLT